jgi:hypothetical protein
VQKVKFTLPQNENFDMEKLNLHYPKSGFGVSRDGTGRDPNGTGRDENFVPRASLIYAYKVG